MSVCGGRGGGGGGGGGGGVTSWVAKGVGRLGVPSLVVLLSYDLLRMQVTYRSRSLVPALGDTCQGGSIVMFGMFSSQPDTQGCQSFQGTAHIGG